MSIQDLIEKYTNELHKIDIEIRKNRLARTEPDVRLEDRCYASMLENTLSYRESIIQGFLNDLKKVTE